MDLQEYRQHTEKQKKADALLKRINIIEGKLRTLEAPHLNATILTITPFNEAGTPKIRERWGSVANEHPNEVDSCDKSLLEAVISALTTQYKLQLVEAQVEFDKL